MITGGLGTHGGFFVSGLGGFVARAIAAVRRGAGKRGKKSWLSRYEQRASDDSLADEAKEAIARDTRVFEREKQILVENTRMMFAEEAIDKRLATKKQRLMNLERANIAREKKAVIAKFDKEKKEARAAEIKKTRLKNLKKARAAKRRKAKGKK